MDALQINAEDVLSDLNFQNNNFINDFWKQPKQQKIRALNQHTPARLLIESEKLAQAGADEFPKRLQACAEAWGRQTVSETEHLQ